MEGQATDEVLLELLARTVEHVADIVEITDAKGTFQYVNRAFERHTGYMMAEVLDQTPASLLRSGCHTDTFYEDIWHTIEAGHVWTGRIISKSRSGELMHLEAVINPVRNHSGAVTHYVAVKRDISEREKLQGRLMEQSDRMAVVGQLVAGFSHEINNPLTYILSNLGYLASVTERAEGLAVSFDAREFSSILAETLEGAERIRLVVQELRRIARPLDDHECLVDVRTLLDRTLHLVRTDIQRKARLVKDFGDVPTLWSNPQRLSQVFLNLLLNALQEFPLGGASTHKIRLRTTTDARGWAVVQISDNGPGIPHKVQGQIFEPFFTTKPQRGGTGLGLTVSRDIIARLGGTMQVDSKEGGPTIFTICMPPLDPATTPGVETPKQSARVLVVDDEVPLLRILRRTLRGYDVTTCSHPEDAFLHLSEGAFDVVLCDLTMPQMTGVELFKKLVALKPTMARRFVFMSAGTCSAAEREYLDRLPNIVLDKPFSTTEVRNLVSEVIAGPLV